MEKIISELTNNFNLQINKIVNEHNLLKNTIDDKNKNIEVLTEDNYGFKTRINEMIEEKKSKSSSALWESTQVQLKEKDLIIDNLKKELEFYKRNSKSNNVMDKYPYNINNNTINNNNTNSNTKSNINKNELEIHSINDVSKQKNNISKLSEKNETLKCETNIRKEISEELKIVQEQVEVEADKEEKEEKEEVEEETIVELKVKKSKKDRSKDKTEKKKKKKEIIKIEDDDINELEKELAGL
jgi:hypothetical protein